MKKCPQTASGKHRFTDKVFDRWSGQKYTQMEDTSMFVYERRMELVEHEKAIYFPKCTACGFINDSKEIIE